jgi:hypothetical protein
MIGVVDGNVDAGEGGAHCCASELEPECVVKDIMLNAIKAAVVCLAIK